MGLRWDVEYASGMERYMYLDGCLRKPPGFVGRSVIPSMEAFGRVIETTDEACRAMAVHETDWS